MEEDKDVDEHSIASGQTNETTYVFIP